MHTKKGFTLIELLVVLAIVAVLSVVVIFVLNPAEVLRQSRDSTRLSDTGAIKKAITLYLATVNSSAINIGSTATCYVSVTSTSANCGGVFGAYFATTATSSPATDTGVDGTGWIPVNFRLIPSGAPFGTLPVDPVNDPTYYYAYAPSSTSLTFEVDANMESTKYKNGGAKDVESTDGGNNANWYESGTAAGLAF